MSIYNGLDNLPETVSGQVVIIGNFDGIHRGHRMLIDNAKAIARQEGRQVVLLTFEPHPRDLFRPDDPPFRLTPLALKAELAQEAGVSDVIALPFTWEVASQSAGDFIEEVLKDKLAAAHIVVGTDFCFGQLRKGTPETMSEAGLKVTALPPEQNQRTGEKYSSTTARQYLRQGKIEAANAVLGWPWEVRGEVIRGDRRGRELGYPTANVRLGETLHPAYGVYAAWVRIEGEEKWWPSATNIGIRPMFEVPEGQVEAYIMDGFDRDIYDRVLHVRPVARLRGEAKFDSLEDLMAQMKMDCAQSRQMLKAGNNKKVVPS